MAAIIHQLKKYWTEPVFPPAAFLLSRHYIGGVHFSLREKKVRHHFLFPLKPGILEPSFDKKNIWNPTALESQIQEGIHQLHFLGKSVGLLIPESCLKIFILSFDVLPSAPKEREEFILWRLKRLIPFKATDVKVSFDVLQSKNGVRVIIALAHESIVREYENFFATFGFRMGVLSIPALALVNGVNLGEEKDVMIVNLEEDSVSLIVVLDSEISLYRFKTLSGNSFSPLSAEEKMAHTLAEIENTVRFVEDKEKKKLNTLWVRLAFLDQKRELFSLWQERLSLPFRLIQPSPAVDLSSRDKQILMPLIGQVG
ncbi:MAG: hypothetical protein WCC06_11855 [Candidatus Aminicenantales bacterium]